MKERSSHQALPNETTRASGLIVPGEYADTQTSSPLRPKSGETKNKSKERGNVYEQHSQAYQDIVDPRHVIELKDAIKHAESKVGTQSENINTELPLREQKQAVRDQYIQEYLQTGSPSKDRPIPEDIKIRLEELLDLTFEELEAQAYPYKGDLQEKNRLTIPVDLPDLPDFPPPPQDNSSDLPDIPKDIPDQDNQKNDVNEQGKDKKLPDIEIEELSRMIDAADAIADPDQRLRELNAIIKRCIDLDNQDDSQGYSDMAVVAALRIKYPQKRGIKGRLKDVATLGDRKIDSSYKKRSQESDKAFAMMADKLNNQASAIDAANQIDNKNERNSALQNQARKALKRSLDAEKELKKITPGDQLADGNVRLRVSELMREVDDQFDITKSIVSMIGSRDFRKYIELDDHILDGEGLTFTKEDETARRGIAGYLKRQKQYRVLYELAVSLDDHHEGILELIKNKDLRQKVIDEIQRKKHL